MRLFVFAGLLFFTVLLHGHEPKVSAMSAGTVSVTVQIRPQAVASLSERKTDVRISGFLSVWPATALFLLRLLEEYAATRGNRFFTENITLHKVDLQDDL